MAFHPDFSTNRRVYLHWSDRGGDTRVAEFRVRRDWSIPARPLRKLLHVRQPEENHNGGHLAFGPDGRLHLGLGDGGGAFNPHRTAQNLTSKLGKIIATKVVRRPRWRVVVYGLRNPWRFSFDPALGEMWIADVGQDSYEEINRILLEADEPPRTRVGASTKDSRRCAAVTVSTGQESSSGLSPATRTATAARSPAGTSTPASPSPPWIGATSTATSASERYGRSRARPAAARPTSGANTPKCRSSPTSGPMPTASCCSLPVLERFIGRLGPKPAADPRPER